jgi:Predicted unsaturated glucuronyl hydrolase involved in regulation of bacterial surface properties, and related proteins
MVDPALGAIRASTGAGLRAASPAHRAWPTFLVGDSGENELRLYWADTQDLARPLCLRVTIARESWEMASLVALGRWGEIGRALLDHVDAFEHVDLWLRPSAEADVGGGIALRLESPGQVAVFGPGAGEGGRLGPRLFPAGARAPGSLARLLDGLASPASLQAFGWKLGCVVDGLLDLGEVTGEERFARRAEAHLSEFLAADGTLEYHDPWGRPVRGGVYGIEGLLPIAALARLGETDRAIAQCEQFLRDYRRDDGVVLDHDMLSAEGMYTVAYPLALVGFRAGREDFIASALRQLRVRAEALYDGDVLLRRYEDGRVEFRDWIRAWTWYLLGLARVAPILAAAGVDVAPERERLAVLARAAAEHRAPDGLWHTFVRDASTPLETSGSAGIAAAWALGARAGLLDAGWRAQAASAADALIPLVGAEGALTGASQANKDGDRLQRARYRINSQMGSGLLGQLVAALHGNAPGS